MSSWEMKFDRTIARRTSVWRSLAESGCKTGFHSVGAWGRPASVEDAGEIAARVAVEALVLDRDRRLDHGRGDVLQLDREAVVAVVADIRQDHLAGAVVDDRVPRKRRGVEALDRGQAVEEGLGVS